MKRLLVSREHMLKNIKRFCLALRETLALGTRERGGNNDSIKKAMTVVGIRMHLRETQHEF